MKEKVKWQTIQRISVLVGGYLPLFQLLCFNYLE